MRDDPLHALRSRSTTRLVIIVAAVVALGAGTAAAVGLAVSPHSSTPGGSSIFIPVVSGASAGTPAAAQPGVALGAPGVQSQPNSAAAIQPSGVASGIAYPYPPINSHCSPAAPAQLQGQSVVATGLAQIGSVQSAQSYTVNATINQRAGGASLHDTFASVGAKVSAIRTAFQHLNIPDSNIEIGGVNINGSIVPASGIDQQPAGSPDVTVSASVSARIDNSSAVVASIDAVVAAGATSVNEYVQSGSAIATPNQDALNKAVAAATSSARSLAATSATAAGVSIGDLRGAIVQPPTLCYGTGGPALVVAVEVSFAIK